MLDEIKLTPGIWFDKKDMEFKGFTFLGEFTPERQKFEPGDHALLIVFQPFQGPWIQIIGSFISRSCATGDVQHNLIIEAIKLMEKSGFYVDGVTADGASWNRAVWSLAGVNECIVSCKHPMDESEDENDDENDDENETRQLWFFSDWSHLLKNFRNFVISLEILFVRRHFSYVHFDRQVNFQKVIFFPIIVFVQTPYGMVKRAHWEALLAIERPNTLSLKLAYKLTRHHIYPDTYEKMRVPLAVEVTIYHNIQ